MTIYLIVDFSFLGLQLTLQYALPLLIGVVTSGFGYDDDGLIWVFKWFTRLCIAVLLMFTYGYLFRGGYTPASAAVPMLLSVLFSIVVASYFVSGDKKYLLYAGLVFMVPVIDLTRMGIAAMSAIFVLHFANHSLKRKVTYGAMGILAFIMVFNSRGFQEKTFYGGEGTISDLTLDYYDNPNFRSSGRVSWKDALEPGLKAKPIWGNGPRADNAYLTKISKRRGGEAHNDYLSVRFNYGYVGLSLLLFGFAGSFASLYRVSRRYSENHYLWLLSTSALTLFISFLMFMYSDNILKYTIYFPNYFFAIIGIVYGLKRDEAISRNTSIQ